MFVANSDLKSQKDSNNNLIRCFLPIADELLELKTTIKDLMPCETQIASKVINHVFANNGKCIRPALFLLLCRMLGYKGPHRLNMAAVTEFVHTASLIHDDVIDNSPIRRNKPTAHRKWGSQTAVLVGDLIYARASELMAATQKSEIVVAFATAIRSMSEGELLQLEQVYNLDLSTQTYFRMIAAKTASLMGAAARSAGILADTNNSINQALYDFAYNTGIAFQLIDDALDYSVDNKYFGKKPLSDLMEGKVTYPLILLRKRLNNFELIQLQTAFSQQPINKNYIQPLTELLQKYSVISDTIAHAKQYTKRAINILESNFYNINERKELIFLVECMISRVV